MAASPEGSATPTAHLLFNAVDWSGSRGQGAVLPCDNIRHIGSSIGVAAVGATVRAGYGWLDDVCVAAAVVIRVPLLTLPPAAVPCGIGRHVTEW